MIMLHLRKRQQKTDASKSGGPGYGVKSRSSIEEMESVQPLSDDEMVLFTYHSQCIGNILAAVMFLL